MFEFFDYRDGRPIVRPDLLVLSPFREIYAKDKSKTKEKAVKDLSFVYFYSYYKSPYSVYADPERRKKEVCKAVYRDEQYPVSKEVLDACNEFEKLHETVSMKLLKAAKSGALKLSDYFEETVANPALGDDQITNLSRNLEKIGKIIESLDKLEDKVKREQATNTKIRGRGAGSAGLLEDYHL
jgi:hypothetical protein